MRKQRNEDCCGWKLEWSNEVGGDKFDKALERNFRVTTDDSISKYNSDPVTLLTHVIASDVHYGETTLHPLSSIIASIKYRNPHVQVIMMLNERSALKDSIAELVEQIELKVLQKHEDGYVFNIHVRDVIQSSPTIGGESKLQMKLIECWKDIVGSKCILCMVCVILYSIPIVGTSCWLWLWSLKLHMSVQCTYTKTPSTMRHKMDTLFWCIRDILQNGA